LKLASHYFDWFSLQDAKYNVRFGSLAGITARSRHIHFTPNHGRWRRIEVRIWLSVSEYTP